MEGGEARQGAKKTVLYPCAVSFTTISDTSYGAEQISDIERLLLVSKTEQEMSDRERGLLIVVVSGMRTWAAGVGGSKREVSTENGVWFLG